MGRNRSALVAAALLLDGTLGEPPPTLHPTVWMGHAIAAAERPALRLRAPRSRRLAGAALALLLPTGTFLLARTTLNLLPPRLRPPAEAALLSTTLALRGLDRAARNVEHELERGDLPAARARVGEFVGRDTEDLTETEVARAAVESVAENTSDGVVAPMLYGLLLGAPGALAYKAVNTLDSMVGYRDPPYADLGRASARLDDLANLLPARLTVLAVSAVSGRPSKTLRTARRYGPLTSSPNAGWAEAAFAGALDLRLGGANTYGGVPRTGPTLGDGHPPKVADVRRARRLMRRACWTIIILTLTFSLAFPSVKADSTRG